MKYELKVAHDSGEFEDDDDVAMLLADGWEPFAATWIDVGDHAVYLRRPVQHVDRSECPSDCELAQADTLPHPDSTGPHGTVRSTRTTQFDAARAAFDAHDLERLGRIVDTAQNRPPQGESDGTIDETLWYALRDLCESARAFRDKKTSVAQMLRERS